MSQINIQKATEEIKWLALAVSTDRTRANLTRIHVEGTQAVATDGHRLHYIEGTSLPTGFSLRGNDALRILDLVKDYDLVAIENWDGGTRWKFVSADGACDLVCNKGDYRFPDYKSVLPRDGELADRKSADLRKTYVGENGKVDFCAIGPGHFNARYVTEALRGAPKTVLVLVPPDKDSPTLFRYGNRNAVVMPVRQ